MARKLTIYRKCPCKETAHDYTGEDKDGKMIYACRNCFLRRTSKDKRTLRIEGSFSKPQDV